MRLRTKLGSVLTFYDYLRKDHICFNTAVPVVFLYSIPKNLYKMLPRLLSYVVIYCLDAVTYLFNVISSCISVCYIIKYFLFSVFIHSVTYLIISIIPSFDYIFRYILSPKHRSIAQARDL